MDCFYTDWALSKLMRGCKSHLKLFLKVVSHFIWCRASFSSSFFLLTADFIKHMFKVQINYICHFSLFWPVTTLDHFSIMVPSMLNIIIWNYAPVKVVVWFVSVSLSKAACQEYPHRKNYRSQHDENWDLKKINDQEIVKHDIVFLKAVGVIFGVNALLPLYKTN